MARATQVHVLGTWILSAQVLFWSEYRYGARQKGTPEVDEPPQLNKFSASGHHAEVSCSTTQDMAHTENISYRAEQIERYVAVQYNLLAASSDLKDYHDSQSSCSRSSL